MKRILLQQIAGPQISIAFFRPAQLLLGHNRSKKTGPDLGFIGYSEVVGEDAD
ncbi:hypothetical protein [Pseudomonas frederiksbergensis]|jgi:hypothetical protein|uniref:hypothetical protein n=1 Tax=Pseudomonas frederiksbergensis TaxID=104087 RepID=UPI001610211C|nr:hypothetical protein [Pseudomonas frederiksbergensis]